MLIATTMNRFMICVIASLHVTRHVTGSLSLVAIYTIVIMVSGLLRFSCQLRVYFKRIHGDYLLLHTLSGMFICPQATNQRLSPRTFVWLGKDDYPSPLPVKAYPTLEEQTGE